MKAAFSARTVSLAFCLALCAAGSAYADCTYPTAPDKLPDGRTATMADMVTAQKAVKQFDLDINAYIACIKLEYDDSVKKVAVKPGEKPTADQQKAVAELERVQIQKHNAALDADQSIADRFNEQVRAFKAKAADQKK
jgi:hypothetical protein